MMFLTSRFSSAAKNAIQQANLRDLLDLEPPPVRKSPAADTPNLVSEKLDGALVDSVIVRFDNSFLVEVDDFKQAFLFNGQPDDGIGDFRRHTHRVDLGSLPVASRPTSCRIDPQRIVPVAMTDLAHFFD